MNIVFEEVFISIIWEFCQTLFSLRALVGRVLFAALNILIVLVLLAKLCMLLVDSVTSCNDIENLVQIVQILV